MNENDWQYTESTESDFLDRLIWNNPGLNAEELDESEARCLLLAATRELLGAITSNSRSSCQLDVSQLVRTACNCVLAIRSDLGEVDANRAIGLVAALGSVRSIGASEALVYSTMMARSIACGFTRTAAVSDAGTVVSLKAATLHEIINDPSEHEAWRSCLQRLKIDLKP